MSRAFGSVRQSQVITTYGPGALIDLPSQDRLTRTLVVPISTRPEVSSYNPPASMSG